MKFLSKVSYFFAVIKRPALVVFAITLSLTATAANAAIDVGTRVPINGNVSAEPKLMASINDVLFFSVDGGDGNGRELWTYDPSQPASGSNPKIVVDLHPGPVGSTPDEITALGGKLYFEAYDGSSLDGVELWVYDPANPTISIGKVDGSNPRMINIAQTVTYSSYPAYFAEVNGKLYFEAFDGTEREVWVFDPGIPTISVGTNPKELFDINGDGNGNSNVYYLTEVNGLLAFRANDGTNGSELWIYDPTVAVSVGTNPFLVDIDPGGNSNIESLTSVNSLLFFYGANSNGYFLFQYDTGSAVAGAPFGECGGGDNPCILDIHDDNTDPCVFAATGLSDLLYLQAGCPDLEFYVFDPVKAISGTNPTIINISIPQNSYPFEFTEMDGKVYFNASDTNSITQRLWVYDPSDSSTTVGVNPNKVTITGDNIENPFELHSQYPYLFFQGEDGTLGTGLYEFEVEVPPDPILGEIFADGFESGDISAWSSSTGAELGTDYNAYAKCKLCVIAKKPLVGSYSLDVKPVGSKPHYLADSSPAGEGEYHAQFKIKLGKSLKMGNKNKIKIFEGRMDGNKKAPFTIELRKSGFKFQVRAVVKTDGKKAYRTKWKPIPKKTTLVEVEWTAAASNGANDGSFTLWVNEKVKGSNAKLDNDSFVIDEVRLGVVGKLKKSYTVSGYFKLDAFDSDKFDYMGK